MQRTTHDRSCRSAATGRGADRGADPWRPVLMRWSEDNGLAKYWLAELPLGTSGKQLHCNASVASGGTGNVVSVTGGLTSLKTEEARETPVWATLQSGGAELMVTRDGDPIDPAGQGILFYLYSPDLAALRGQLLANGVEAGEIEDGTPGPRQEMKVTDPDGYVLMVAQIEPDEPDSARLEGSLGELDAAGEDFQSEDERADHTDLPEQGDRV
jgi:hypothetical protein